MDKNPLAVELAKLALWLESHAEGMPLTFMDHRLILGDSLTGPFWDKLVMRPSKPDEPIEGLFHQGLALKLQNTLHNAIRYVRHLDETLGTTVSEIEEKEKTKAELDRALLPFRIAAAAWSGGVMLGPDKCDDLAYGELLKSIADTGDVPAEIESEGLAGMIAMGLGVENIPPDRESLYAVTANGACVPNLPYDLAFPEVFYPTGVPHERHGFHVVLGNPPWDAVKSDATEFFANYNIAYAELSSKVERESLAEELLQHSGVAIHYKQYVEGYHAEQRIHDALFIYQREKIGKTSTSRQLDRFRLFTERAYHVLNRSAFAGLVLPSGFHTNSGAASLRKLLCNKSRVKVIIVFHNTRGLFEIASHLKFDLLVFQHGGATSSFKYGCGLDDPIALFEGNGHFTELSADQWRLLSPDFLTLPEVATAKDLEILTEVQPRCTRMSSFCEDSHLNLSREVNMDAGPRVIGTGPGEFLLVTGREIDFYQVDLSSAAYHIKPGALGSWKQRICFFRLTMKRVVTVAARGKFVAGLLPPKILTSGYGETNPALRANCVALSTSATANSFVVDYFMGPRVKSTLNLFMLDDLPWPHVASDILAHSALRLICNLDHYAPLWHEQLGDEWREVGKAPLSWPVLVGDDERWEVRAAVDAVVADAYDLSRDQYEHILSTFSHASYKKAPELCLARFDELKKIGLEAFTKKHDPYWDIPLNENLPQPVIDLPIPGDDNEGDDGEFKLTGTPKRTRRRKSKRM